MILVLRCKMSGCILNWYPLKASPSADIPYTPFGYLRHVLRYLLAGIRKRTLCGFCETFGRCLTEEGIRSLKRTMLSERLFRLVLKRLLQSLIERYDEMLARTPRQSVPQGSH
jgi:hypothetical protein